MSLTPSTQWTERIEPDELARQQEFADYLTRMQSRLNDKLGKGRALHRKQRMALRGSLAVVADLPEYAAQGLFATARQYSCVIRLSNGSPNVASDAIPDIRGFAFSVRGLDGPGALDDRTDRQDFLLINRSSFGVPTSKEFADVVKAMRGKSAADAKRAVSRYRSLAGARELARFAADTVRPFNGFAATTFHSAAPIQFGPYAARVRLVPATKTRSLTELIGIGNQMAQHVAKNPLEYHLHADFYVDESITPIEDASSPWPRDQVPSAHVATLTIDQQDISDTTGVELAKDVEAGAFDPWKALAAHRPLGEVMRARKVAYYASQQNRR